MNMNRVATNLAVVFFLWAGVSIAASSAVDEAVVYVADEIITMDPEHPVATAVAVADGRILGVGSKEDMLALTGAGEVDTRFADKVMVPGLIEQHIHPVLSALTLTTEIISIEDWILPDRTFPAVRDREEYLSTLSNAEVALTSPTEPLISWGFHHYFHDSISRTDLDKISTTRPILIWHRSAHEFILNSPALESIGMTDALIAEQSAEIQAQLDIEKGHFWERGLFEFLLPRLMPIIASPDRLHAGLALTERYLHAAGVTTSAEPGGLASMYPIQNTVLGDSETPFRFYFIPDGRTLGLQFPLDELAEATEKMMTGLSGHTAFLPKQVKLFADGAIFSQLMQMQDGYTDDHHGEWMMEPEVYAGVFRAYWEAGYQIHIHQNGDQGLEMVLDLLEENMQRMPREDHRTTIVHFGFSTAKQVKRIAALGAIVSANPYYTSALADRYSEVGIGPQRADQMVRLADVAAENISFSLHSDMPMAPAQPLFLMWAAVNRTTFSGRTAAPEQRISVEAALKAVTLDAAYSLRLENEVGSISPGKRANFTVLEASPYRVEPATIKDIEIWGTVLEGRLQPISR
jgi:predicted amidohydrolase YtcJ